MKRVESTSGLPKEEKLESSLMLSAHAVAAELLTQADGIAITSFFFVTFFHFVLRYAHIYDFPFSFYGLFSYSIQAEMDRNRS